MKLCIGIDLGTSAVKLLLVDETGAIRNEVSREYPLSFPHPGWSEQEPRDWWEACLTGIPELLEGFDPAEVAGIGAGACKIILCSPRNKLPPASSNAQKKAPRPRGAAPSAC